MGATRLRPEHEVVDDELTPPGEELGQGLPAIGSLEKVIFVDALSRQLSPLLAQLIAELGEFLLLDQELLARRDPCIVRDDVVMRH